jgi:rhamnosyltransferase
MKSELFIDYVDLEWCLRAGALGYQHFQVDHVQMLHAIGGEPIVFMGKNWPSHSALRHYYMFRNAIWMYRQSHIPLCWKWIDGFKLIRKFIFYSLFAKPWVEQVKMMLRGLFDGFTGKMGAFSDAKD